MPELACPIAAGPPADQAAGLRRIFAHAPVQWSLVLQPAARSESGARGLADRARQLAAQFGHTLVIDCARTQLAASMGMALRYDLEHVLASDCALEDACLAAEKFLWVLPAAKALDAAYADKHHAQTVALAIQAVASAMRHVMLVLPATRVSWIENLPGLQNAREALIPVVRGADSGAAVLTAVRQAAGEAQIDTFHLLFLGMPEAGAGRLLTGLAAIAQRHFGARLLAVPPSSVAHAAEPGARSRSVESVF